MDIESQIEKQLQESMRRSRIRADFVACELQRPEAFRDRITAGQPVRFNTISLPGWIGLARMAGLPLIPFRTLGALPVTSYIESWDDPESDFPSRAKEIVSHLQAGEILRLEHVAPYAVKSALARGRPLVSGIESDGGVDLHDMRFVDTLMQLNEPDIRFLARPIVETKKVPGVEDSGEYPLEIRVFVQGGRLIGVSNYYPQTRMGEDHLDLIREALGMSAQLMGFMRQHDIAPANPSFGPHPDGPSFTLDFLTQKGGGLLFLEGGPAGIQAAHPCCFMTEDHEFRGDPRLHGVALSLKDEILPLAEVYPGEIPDLCGMHQPVPDYTMPEASSPSL